MKRGSNGDFVQSVCSKSQLQLFQRPTEESCIQDTHVLEVYPIAPLDNDGPIEFVVQRSDRYYIDLYNSCVKLSVQVTNEDGSSVGSLEDEYERLSGSKTVTIQEEDGTEISGKKKTAGKKSHEFKSCPIPVNNFAHTLFSNCSLEVEGTPIGAAHNLYPYVAYLMNTLNLTASAKESLIKTQALYVSDLVEGSDPTMTPVKVNMSQNKALKERCEATKNSRVVHMYMKPFIDFFQQAHYLLNNVEIRLTMRRSRPEFALMRFSDTSNSRFRIKFVSATLELRRITLAENTAKSFEASLARGLKATYWFPTMDGRHFELAKGQHNYTAMNVFSGPLPQRAFLFLQPSEAFLGSYDTNPLIFWHYHVTQVNFMIDDVSIRAKPIMVDFDTKNPNYLNAYKSLFEVMRATHSNADLDVDYESYARKLCLFGIDITADQSYDSPSKKGNFSIDIRFAKPTPMALKGICIGEFKCGTLINKDRNVEVNIL